jgi:AcrR family transcriptional regulator
MVTISNDSLRERKKAACRQRIVDVAIDLFGQRGIDAVTVDDIARAAEVGKGTIYNYFDAKEDIVVAFMLAFEAKVQAEVGRLADSDAPLAAILCRFVELQFGMKEPHYAFVRVFLAQMFGRTQQFMPHLLEMQKAIDPPLEALFARLRERGMMRRDIPLPQVILAFKTVHVGLSALWAVEGPPFHAAYSTLRIAMKLFCEGLEINS